jgi:arylsulfatase A-like enzyme
MRFIPILTLFVHFVYGQSTQPYKIYWDEKLIQGRKQFLAQKYSSDPSVKKPNIIIILADDLGQTDISLYGNKLITTPNIDAIGLNGVTFNEAYITSPVCSPSRAGLLTGRYQQRFGHELQMNDRYPKNIIEFLAFKILPTFRPVTPIWIRSKPSDEDRMRQGLPPSEITLAEVLQVNGYTTAIIGKWHLGAQDFALPCNRGFDYQYGFNEAFTLYMDTESPEIVNGKVKGQYMDNHQWRTAEGRTGNCAITRNCCESTDDPDYLTDRLTTEAIQFIDRNKTRPFFLYLPYSAPHAPIQAPKSYYEQLPHVGDHVQRTYLAMIKNLDDQIGRLMKNLDSLQLTENTLIFFLSDNGGASYNGSTDNAPYRGGKLTNFEGGIRVPFMMQWKSKIPEGVVFNHPVSSLDIFATSISAASAQLPQDRTFDGVDLIPYLSKTALPHPSLYWRSDVCKAIRQGQWKLLINEVSGRNSLYNMTNDAEEVKNLYDQLPDVVHQLNQNLKIWESEMMKPMWPRTVNYIYKDKQGKQKFAF